MALRPVRQRIAMTLCRTLPVPVELARTVDLEPASTLPGRSMASSRAPSPSTSRSSAPLCRPFRLADSGGTVSLDTKGVALDDRDASHPTVSAPVRTRSRPRAPYRWSLPPSRHRRGSAWLPQLAVRPSLGVSGDPRTRRALVDDRQRLSCIPRRRWTPLRPLRTRPSARRPRVAPTGHDLALASRAAFGSPLRLLVVYLAYPHLHACADQPVDRERVPPEGRPAVEGVGSSP
jgi:hypothetical protein